MADAERSLPAGGIRLEDPLILKSLWKPWEPADVALRLAGLHAPWYVAAGWALDLFLGRESAATASREHEDLEVAVPVAAWPEVAAALAGLQLWGAGDGLLWPLADPEVDAAAVLAAVHQTWVRDPATGAFVLDVFREPHDGDRWICRRDETLRRPYGEIIDVSRTGIPYLRPEWVLLFKAKATRPKDTADFRRVLPVLDDPTRRRTHDLLARVLPGHPWLDSF